MVLTLFAITFYVPWTAAISVQPQADRGQA